MLHSINFLTSLRPIISHSNLLRISIYPLKCDSTKLIVRSYLTFLQAPARKLDLGNLSDNRKATQEKRRLGRGPASGRGKTCGRGHKGQKARTGNGKPRRGFEGGQTPLSRRFPKRGFNNPFEKTWAPLNLDRLQHWIDNGRIDPTQPITMKHLLDTRCVRGIKDGVKLLADGREHFKTPITIEVARASQKAIKSIESVGGTITCRYFNRLALRATIKPEKFWKIPKFATPMKQRDIAWYSDPNNRGYLSQSENLKERVF